ncbi:cardiolipin synthase [Peredibacter starrii]|uniref:Cardiolipin synthase n=1 Tax=Peredibacter starrii TaxID=28202 RepID=A0AAX4HL46_9BACT|nr:cardiolipin synthase [Peredibacter starrii]WPU63878.1 cardiolipin synthase [Peredibacter starrii]
MVIRLEESTVVIIVIFHILGVIAAFYALFQSRTPQGMVAWAIGLVTFPLIALPVFLLFGKRRPSGYLEFDVLKEYPINSHDLVKHFENKVDFLTLSEHPYMAGNDIKLLIDGKTTFHSMLQSIDEAKEYVLLQMYIFRTDAVGKKFAEALSKKAREGVKVYLLYDNHAIFMKPSVLKELEKAGVKFGSHSPGKRSKFYLNFRNHRKLLIVDGKVGYWGGVNIGLDYVGALPEIGYWRDTNVRVTGPAVMLGQTEFAKDWNWSKKDKLDVRWEVAEPTGNTSLIIHNSNPIGPEAMNLLQHVEMINSAKERIWIANPYVVPPQQIMDALSIAAIKHLDVRVIAPLKSDNDYVSGAAEMYYERLLKYGIKVYRYQKGMMHQKVMLIDDKLGIVGSSNLDFRSMFINFENGIITNDKKFLLELEAMLKQDFNDSIEMALEDYKLQSFYKKFRTRVLNAFAPIM